MRSDGDMIRVRTQRLGTLAGFVGLALPAIAAAVEFNVADGDVAGLIAAINAANDEVANPGPDTINLAANGTYTLTAIDNDTDGPNGLPSITSEITINGKGATVGRSEDAGTSDFRIAHVSGSGDLALNALTFKRGRSSGDIGGGLYNSGGFAALNSCMIVGNGGFGNGGGIYNDGGEITLASTMVINNGAFSGGGVFNAGGDMRAIDSTIRNNGGGFGSGVYNEAGYVELDRCTIARNGNETYLAIYSTGEMHLTNCSITDNQYQFEASWGGIGNNGGILTLTHCTLTGNQYPAIDTFNGGVTTLSNTIVAGAGDSCNGNTVDAGYNIFWGDPECITHATSISANPSMTPLSDYGGPTQTHALLPDSPALHAGDCAAGTVLVDQRGVPRPQGSACDIGAFEREAAPCSVPDPIPDGDSAALIAAIQCANLTPGSATINLASDGHYTLNESVEMIYLQDADDAGNGLPTVFGELTISANGATIARSSAEGTPRFRILFVGSGAELSVNDATLTNGFVAESYGGGLYNDGGNIRLSGCTISSNRVQPGFAAGHGAGIFHRAGDMSIVNSTISGNSGGFAGGGICVDEAGTASIQHTTIANNSSGDGGGICNGGTITLENSIVIANTGNWGGGVAAGGVTSVTHSTITGNIAETGAGFHISGNLYMENTLVGANVATGVGGGTYVSGTASIDSSTFANNEGANGAGATVNGSLWMQNSTISANDGHGVWEHGGTVALTHCTISDNVAGGVVTFRDDRGGTVAINNSILANNIAGDCLEDVDGVIDLGFNIIEDGSCISHPTSMSGDPMLGPLADNGGPTPTHALLPGSIAIDAGDCAGGTVTEDQRGVSRPRGAACDIGAFEFLPGDVDGDGDVDLTDFALFGQCYTGPNVPPNPGCPPGVNADLDGDNDVDLTDFKIFGQNFTGSL